MRSGKKSSVNRGFCLFNITCLHLVAVHILAARMTTQYWLVKSEPEAYAWSDLVRDGRTDWTGVRNYQARNHLKTMRPGDRVFFYASVTTKAVLGLAEVSRGFFPDTTADEEGWVAVELKPVSPLARPVTLDQIKAEPSLKDTALLRQSRLSVMPLTAAEFKKISKLGGL
jgi:predicted RNA-binding protein with PUA-like domain